MPGHPFAGNVAHLSLGLARQPPEHRPVIDVQNRAHLVAARILERQPAHLVHLPGGEMRARDQQRTARGDEGLLEIADLQGHVRAVLPVEDQREAFPILEPEQNQRRQPLRIPYHMAHIAPLPGQRLGQKTPHMILAHPGAASPTSAPAAPCSPRCCPRIPQGISQTSWHPQAAPRSAPRKDPPTASQGKSHPIHARFETGGRLHGTMLGGNCKIMTVQRLVGKRRVPAAL